MAGIVSGFYVEDDPANGRVLVGLTQDGIVHKINILRFGWSRIVQHIHSYGHWYKVKIGAYRLTDTAPGGVETVSIASEGDELFMPAWHQHAFDRIDQGTDPGVIDCFWPEGADQ